MGRLAFDVKEKYRRLPFETKVEIRDLFIKKIVENGFRVVSVVGLKVDWVVTKENKKCMNIKEVREFMKKHSDYDVGGFPKNLPLRLQKLVDGKASVVANRIHAKVIRDYFLGR